MSSLFHNGGHVLVTKRGTTSPDNVLEFLPWNLIIVNKLGHHLHREICIRKRPPAFEFLHGHCGDGVGYEKATIMGKTAHDHFTETQVLLSFTSSS
jgi:hypothetical protein